MFIILSSFAFGQLLNRGQSVNSSKPQISNKFLETEVFSFLIKKQTIPNILKISDIPSQETLNNLLNSIINKDIVNACKIINEFTIR